MELSQYPKPVVVGIDGSSAAIYAALWAAKEAVSHDAPLQLAYVMADAPASARPGDFDSEFDYGMDVLESARDAVSAANDSVKIDTKLHRGNLARTLIDLGATAELVAVGSSGIGHVAEILLGSTAGSLARGAHCPVAIVRGENSCTGPHSTGPVVVPVESGELEDAAVHAAFREAALRRAELLVVHLHQPRPWAVPPSTTQVGKPMWTDPAVEKWRAAYPGVDAREIAVTGYSGSYLEQLSRSSRLMVVARRGGSDKPAHLGSTAHAMLYHAKCPVLVVPR
jgi:nucleotide-binding universal stress UspA family protein